MSDANIRELYDQNIGLKLCLTNHFMTREDIENSRDFLRRYHRDGNAIVTLSDELATFVKHNFPKYAVDLSMISELPLDQIDRALELCDNVTLPPSCLFSVVDRHKCRYSEPYRGIGLPKLQNAGSQSAKLRDLGRNPRVRHAKQALPTMILHTCLVLSTNIVLSSSEMPAAFITAPIADAIETYPPGSDKWPSRILPIGLRLHASAAIMNNMSSSTSTDCTNWDFRNSSWSVLV